MQYVSMGQWLRGDRRLWFPLCYLLVAPTNCESNSLRFWYRLARFTLERITFHGFYGIRFYIRTHLVSWQCYRLHRMR